MNRQNVTYVCLSMVVGIFLAGIISEAAYRFQAGSQDRAAGIITLVIPAGSAEQVSQGEQPASIPEGMTFVVGDTLVVKNEDSVDHQLGPLFIPRGSSASLTFQQVANLAYVCSFSRAKYLGLDIKAPLTIFTRLVGIMSVGLPLGALIALYVVFAIRPGMKGETT